MKKAKEQHAQRYAYFAKNYLELLRKQSSISKKNAEISEKQLLESEAADAVKSLDEVVTSNDTVKSHSTDAIIVHEETNQVYEQPLPVEVCILFFICLILLILDQSSSGCSKKLSQITESRG